MSYGKGLWAHIGWVQLVHSGTPHISQSPALDYAHAKTVDAHLMRRSSQVSMHADL